MKENRVTVLNCYPTDYLIHIKGKLYKGKIEDSQVNQVIKLSIKMAKADIKCDTTWTQCHPGLQAGLCQAFRLVLRGDNEGTKWHNTQWDQSRLWKGLPKNQTGLFKIDVWASLVVQWLRLTSHAGSMRSLPGQASSTCHMQQEKKIVNVTEGKKKGEEVFRLWSKN